MTTTQPTAKTEAETPRTDQRPPTRVFPSLCYDNALGAIAFLTSAFGFTATEVYAADDDPSRIAHAELSLPSGGGVMLGSAPRPDGWPNPRGHGSTYCVVDSDDEVDALFERAVAAGATVLREPRDEDYGGRDFVVLDPEGNQWSFGTYQGA